MSELFNITINLNLIQRLENTCRFEDTNIKFDF